MKLEHIIKPFLSIILTIFILVFLLLYSTFGNQLLLPYASNYLTKQLQDKIQVKVTDMVLTLPNFEVRLLLNDITKVEAQGTINPFSSSFDLNYKLIAPNIICKKRAMGREFYLKGDANGTFKEIQFSGRGKIFSTKHQNTLAHIELKNGIINKALKTVTSDYKFEVDNLSHMTKKRYHGHLNILGKIIYHKGLQIQGGSENFGGYSYFHYQNDRVNLKLSKVDAQKILYLMDYPTMLDAKVNGTVDYHLTHERTNIDLNMKNINFLNCITTQNLYDVLKLDIRKSSFKYGQFVAKTDQEHIQCDFKIQNPNSHLYITRAKINQKLNKLSAYFDMKMQNQELSGKLYGDLYEPNIKINMGALLAFKVKQIMRPTTNFDMKSKFDCIKGVADGLFSGFL